MLSQLLEKQLLLESKTRTHVWHDILVARSAHARLGTCIMPKARWRISPAGISKGHTASKLGPRRGSKDVHG
jgi:hypothetical protein